MTPYLAWIVDFVGRHSHYAVTAIFLLALLEAVPVVRHRRSRLDGYYWDCALATGAHVNPWPLLGAAIVGAIFDDGLSFWLGRRYHRELLQRWPLNRYPQFIDRSEAFIKTEGGASVFLAARICAVSCRHVRNVIGPVLCRQYSLGSCLGTGPRFSWSVAWYGA